MAMMHHPTLKLNRLMTIAFFVISTLTQPIFAENASPDTNLEELEKGHIHHDHANEIGMAAAYAYMEPEGESAFGLHLHLMRRLQGESFKKYFGLGAGFETIFADHMHYNVMGSIAVYPYRDLVVVLSPGILFVEHNDELKERYSTHLEAVYGFLFGGCEIGPVIGIAQSGDDTHYTIGIHLGKGF